MSVADVAIPAQLQPADFAAAMLVVVWGSNFVAVWVGGQSFRR